MFKFTLALCFMGFFFPYFTLANGFKAVISKNGFQPNNFSIWVYNNKTKKVEIDWLSDSLRTPASVSKVITAAVALKELGPSYKFYTSLRQTGVVKDGVLNGELCLHGQGDPSFTSESMWNLVESYRKQNVKLVKGKLMIDDTFFQEKKYPSERQNVRRDRAYDSPMSAVTFNWNSIRVDVKPGREGGATHVFLSPQSDYLKIVNRSKTIKGSKNQITVKRQVVKGEDQILVEGHLGIDYKNKKIQSLHADQQLKTFYKSITQPKKWVAKQLKSFLAEKGIVVEASLEYGKCSSSQNIAQVESKPLEEIVKDLMKYSNNHISEVLTIHLGIVKKNQSTIAAGILVIKDYLKSLGWGNQHFQFVSPSGLSQKNKLSAKKVGQLLQLLSQDFVLSSLFESSLPLAGVDGTLTSRFKVGSLMYQKVRAKTGLLNRVVALSGYLEGRNKEKKTFVIFYNGPRHFDARYVVDDLVASFR